MSTQSETTCSCTFSPLLRSVFGRAFGGEPFGEVPEPGVINITDYGNGPYIPVEWEMLENYSSVVTVYVITNSNGETLIAIGDPGVNQGMKNLQQRGSRRATLTAFSSKYSPAETPRQGRR